MRRYYASILTILMVLSLLVVLTLSVGADFIGPD
jgi:hypothetical protein